MILSIPDKVSWKKAITVDSLAHYNANISKRIQKTHTHRERDAITYAIKPLTRELLDWFVPLYKEKILQKTSPVIRDLYALTLGNTKKSFSILIISEKNTRIGGVIFYETTKEIRIAYKIFADIWLNSNLPASPSLYADYLLTEYGLHTHKQAIGHGKDRNGYGKNSSIGLAIFKISLGYKPYLPKKCTVEEIDTATISCDSLYFVSAIDDSELQGYLFTTKQTAAKWERLHSYTDSVSINWIHR